MAESSPVPPVSTFVVRFWQEWTTAGSRWRGRMVEFVRRVGVMWGDENRLAREEE